MLQSMTGFGRACRITDQRQILVEIRSVNCRYLESSVHLPQNCFCLEPRIKERVRERARRGKVDVFLSLTAVETSKETIQLNEPLLVGYLSALRALSKQYHLPDDLALHHLIQLPNLFSFVQETPDEEELWQIVSPVLSEALEAFWQSRLKEGGRLQADIAAKLSGLAEIVERLREQTPKTVAAYRERLFAQLKTLLQDQSIEESRILTEAAIFADRIAIDEEIVRLESHIAQLAELLEQEEPIGRRCDFLLQEMNREANTIGGKGNDLQVSKWVIELKATLEKIREQIQNIE